ncbi:hypothetical protein [Mesobacillus foraminis]|uniref:Uncharacterized protein n=1 Tax=Mesobacillus foraminis TaxID=279826 RepID=A0A4R2BG78_9BACI|nr:hypothetical protein [Mesobacillus foraminis]TCN24914.1 hypothetical protein EV146_106115 [Mesobacillus foraminis]
MKKVYGLMIKAGDANEMIWDRGVWETEDGAKDYIEAEMKNISGLWVKELTVNDSIPEEVQILEEDMVTCELCGIEYNPADVNTADYDQAVCINCEPEYKQNVNAE